MMLMEDGKLFGASIARIPVIDKTGILWNV
jgi:hypothetical protein